MLTKMNFTQSQIPPLLQESVTRNTTVWMGCNTKEGMPAITTLSAQVFSHILNTTGRGQLSALNRPPVETRDTILQSSLDIMNCWAQQIKCKACLATLYFMIHSFFLIFACATTKVKMPGTVWGQLVISKQFFLFFFFTARNKQATSKELKICKSNSQTHHSEMITQMTNKSKSSECRHNPWALTKFAQQRITSGCNKPASIFVHIFHFEFRKLVSTATSLY